MESVNGFVTMVCHRGLAREFSMDASEFENLVATISRWTLRVAIARDVASRHWARWCKGSA